MMTVDETVALIAARLQPLAAIEAVPLAEADGRILAADLVAPMPLPPFANSAVDGYAIRSADLPQENERRFAIGAPLGRLAPETELPKPRFFPQLAN